MFAVGVGNEITASELVSIANRPSSTYVLYAQDYTTIHRIRDSMEQKLCEGKHPGCSSSCSRSSHCEVCPNSLNKELDWNGDLKMQPHF